MKAICRKNLASAARRFNRHAGIVKIKHLRGRKAAAEKSLPGPECQITFRDEPVERFARCIYMENRDIKNDEHLAILDLIESGDADAADRLVRKHIARRREEINAAVREGLFRLNSDEPVTPYDSSASGERKTS